MPRPKALTLHGSRHISIWLLLLSAISQINCQHVATAERTDKIGVYAGPVAKKNATVQPPEQSQQQPLSLIASEGRLLELQTRLKMKIKAGKGTNAHKRLLNQTEQLITNQKAHDQKRKQKLNNALKDMKMALAGKDYEQGLAHAVIAYGLEPNIAVLRNDPTFQQLISRSQEAARLAQKNRQWLSALNLYRGLNLLYESEGTYLPFLKKAERRIRFLSMYNTAHLQKLLEAKAKADGQTLNVKLDDVPWDRTLKGVKINMYLDALLAAHERHISGPDYTRLLSGAIDNLKDLVLTRSLAQRPDFSALKDSQRTGQFIKVLDGIDQAITERPRLSYRELQQHLQTILAANLKTVTLPMQVLVYELAAGSFEQLDDFSSIIWPVEVAQFNRNVQGRFFGIGVQIIRRDGRLVVVSPLPGTPASKAGILPEDIIAAVDGVPTSGWSLDKAVQTITGKEGTQIVLGIDRRGGGKLIQVPIKRAQIKIHSVLGWQIKPDGTWDIMIKPSEKARSSDTQTSGGIGYLRITQFVPQTAADMDKMILNAVKNHGMRSLILDLRYNPGGLMESAIELTNRFISKGTIVSTVGPNGRVVRRRSAKASGTYPPFPLIVLMNEGSASASEIFAGAIRHYHRGLLIGQRTFGKGSVQDLFDLTPEKDARLKLTTHYYALPSGKIIHRLPGRRYWGVNPNLTMHIMPEVISQQLERRQTLDILPLPPAPGSPGSHESPGNPGSKPGTKKPILLPKGIRPADQYLKEGLDMELEMAVIAAQAILLGE